MPNVEFRAKIETIYNVDDSIAYTRIKVPELKRNHCDMNAFRKSRKFSGFANSDLFPAMLKRAVRDAGIDAYIRLDQPLPGGVMVDASGFLALVTITLAD